MDIAEHIQDDIHSAVLFLAGICDHASSRDNVGFSAATSPVGHELANLPEQFWLPRIYGVAARTVIQHRKQLEKNSGLSPSALDAIAGVAEAFDTEGTEVPSDWARYRPEHDDIILSVTYGGPVDGKRFRNIPGSAQPAGRGRVWSIPGEYAFALAPIIESLHCEPMVRQRIEQSLALSTHEQRLAMTDRKVDARDERFVFDFPFDEGLLYRIKQLPERKWEGKNWTAAACADSATLVSELCSHDRFVCTPEADRLLERAYSMALPERMTVSEADSDHFRVEFSFNRGWVEAIKSLPKRQRKYDPETKSWLVDRRAAALLLETFANDPYCEAIPETAQAQIEAFTAQPDPGAPRL